MRLLNQCTGVDFADGRSNRTKLPRHSLAAAEHAEALENLNHRKPIGAAFFHQQDLRGEFLLRIEVQGELVLGGLVGHYRHHEAGGGEELDGQEPHVILDPLPPALERLAQD